MAKERLIYLPLGGAGEIGMNGYVYGHGPKGRERLILVDAGVTFPDMDTSPGVDLIFADFAWLAERAERLEAIFITHAHEDHVGALGFIAERFPGVPVYARAFTARIARLKLNEAGQDSEIVRETLAWPQTVKAGPFTVGFLPVSHSIPESSAMVVDTPAGRLVHSGDFKLDGTPLVGEAFDPLTWQGVAKGDVLALVCDSTNIFSKQPGRSEETLRQPVTDLVKSARGLVAATTFASNVARLRTLAQAGVDAGRSVVVLGRSMRRMIEVARSAGVLTDFPPTLEIEDAASVPRHRLMVLVTGSQGERRAGSAQLANGKYNGITLKKGDMFLFSSKTIPGNERSVGRIANRFSEMGVEVVDERDGLYHVSGHANRPDIEAVHDLMKPAMVIPMHGEHLHLSEHAAIAQGRGYATIVAPNGAMVELAPSGPRIVEQIETGRRYIDGRAEIGALDGIVRDRIRMALNGHVVVGLIIDEDDEPIGGAWVETHGLPDAGTREHSLGELMEEGVEYELARAGAKTFLSDDALEELVRRTVRRIAMELVGKKPECRVLISRLAAG